MAVFNSIQMSVPRYPVSGPGIGGRSGKHERAEYSFSVTAAVGDTINLFKLHPRFRVTGGYVKQTGLGASTTVAVGIAGTPGLFFAAASTAAAGTNTTLAETGRDYLNGGQYTVVIATIGGATTGTGGTLVVNLTGYVEEPA